MDFIYASVGTVRIDVNKYDRSTLVVFCLSLLSAKDNFEIIRKQK